MTLDKIIAFSLCISMQNFNFLSKKVSWTFTGGHGSKVLCKRTLSLSTTFNNIYPPLRITMTEG